MAPVHKECHEIVREYLVNNRGKVIQPDEDLCELLEAAEEVSEQTGYERGREDAIQTLNEAFARVFAEENEKLK